MSSRMKGPARSACQHGMLLLVVVSSLNSVLCREHRSYDHARTSVPKAQGYEFQMMHRDYQNAPFHSSASNSLRERYMIAAKRSRERANSMMRMLGNPDDSQASVRNGAVSPVFSQQGEYLTYITIGTPAKTFITIVDTGSDLLWVQCRPCLECFEQPDPIFEPTKSSTYKTVNCTSSLCSDLQLASCRNNVCQYSYGYGDGSYTDGKLSLETVALNTTQGTQKLVPNFAFGCGISNDGDFSRSDGIVGLGWGSLSMVTQLAPTLGDKFSYCLVTFSEARTTTSPLTLGEEQPIEPSMKWIPLIRNEYASSFYYVGIEDMSIDGKRLNISKRAFEIDQYGNGGTILDSGTTLYFLESEAYDSLEAGMKPLINYPLIDGSATGFELCYNVSKVESPAFPTIAIHFTGADFVVPENNAFVLIDDEGTACLTMIPTIGFSIVGNLLQQNFLFIYDRENETLGFAPKQCGR